MKYGKMLMNATGNASCRGPGTPLHNRLEVSDLYSMEWIEFGITVEYGKVDCCSNGKDKLINWWNPFGKCETRNYFRVVKAHHT